MTNVIDETGNVYGALTVLGRSAKRYSGNRLVLWDVVCDCGTVKAVTGDRLRRGLALSCGCQKGALVAATRKARRSPEPGPLDTLWGRLLVQEALSSARLDGETHSVEEPTYTAEWRVETEMPEGWKDMSNWSSNEKAARQMLAHWAEIPGSPIRLVRRWVSEPEVVVD